MKRIDGKTPFGGDYAEFHFLDAENNEVDEGKETSIVIRECKADGTLVKETWARVSDNWYKKILRTLFGGKTRRTVWANGFLVSTKRPCSICSLITPKP